MPLVLTLSVTLLLTLPNDPISDTVRDGVREALFAESTGGVSACRTTRRGYV